MCGPDLHDGWCADTVRVRTMCAYCRTVEFRHERWESYHAMMMVMLLLLGVQVRVRDQVVRDRVVRVAHDSVVLKLPCGA